MKIETSLQNSQQKEELWMVNNGDRNHVSHEDSDKSPININEVLFTLSRNAWKLAIFLFVGLIGTAFVYLSREEAYQTSAKLLVRYVLERGGFDSELGLTGSSVDDARGRYSPMEDELEILMSFDLAKLVAEDIGPDRLLGEVAGDVTEEELIDAAAGKVLGNLLVENQGSVLDVKLQANSPLLAEDVLRSLIRNYKKKHLEVRRAPGSAELVAAQREKIRQRLDNIDNELNELKSEAGLSSLVSPAITGSQAGNFWGEEGVDKQNWEIAPRVWDLARKQLMEAETEYATQSSKIRSFQLAEKRRNSPEHIRMLATYQTTIAELAGLRRRIQTLRTKFPTSSPVLAGIYNEIEVLENKKLSLVSENPALIKVTSVDESGNVILAFDLDKEMAVLSGIEGRIKTLKQVIEDNEEKEKNFPVILAKLRRLEQLRAVEEDTYQYFSSAAEKSEIDKVLEESQQTPNISLIQSPVPAGAVLTTKTQIAMAGLPFSALLIGALFVFFTDFVANPVVRRVSQVESILGTRVPIIIPKSRTPAGLVNHARELLDLIGWPVRNMAQAQNPRMIAVIDPDGGAQAQVLMHSLMQVSLQEGEKTLLIDLEAAANHPNSIAELVRKTSQTEEAQRFYAALGLDRSTETSARQFLALMPIFRKWSYNTILFKLPSVKPGSPTRSIINVVDEVILVATQDQTSKEVLKRSYGDWQQLGTRLKCVWRTNEALKVSHNQPRIGLETESNHV